MVKRGQICCIGSGAYIKAKYAKYFEVEIQFKSGNDEQDENEQSSLSLSQIEHKVLLNHAEGNMTRDECLDFLR